MDIVNHGTGLHPSRLVAITLTNSSNGGGYVRPEYVASSVQELSAKFGNNFGGVAAWEYFNSNPNRSEPWRWAELMKRSMARGMAETKKAEDEERTELLKHLRIWR